MKLQVGAGAVLALAAVGALGYAWMKRGAIGASLGTAADAVGDAVNPASTGNLVYRGVNGIGAAATGDDSFSLGGWLYDLTHADPLADVTPATTAPNLPYLHGDFVRQERADAAYDERFNNTAAAFGIWPSARRGDGGATGGW